MPNRGRPRKGGRNPPAEEMSNAFQVLSMLKELGVTTEGLVELMNTKRGEDAMVVATQNQSGERLESTEKVTRENSQGENRKGGRKSWADLVEEEEQDAQAGNGPNQKEKSSWAEVAKGNRDPQSGAPLPYVRPTEVISFTREERIEGAKLWGRTLVGMVIGTTPNYNEMVKYVKANWSEFESVRIHQVQKGVYLFDFQTEEAKNKVLQGKWIVYNRFPLLLKPWSPGMKLEDCIERLPVWIQLPGLSLELWAPKNLGKIVSYVGIPVTTDKCTANRDRATFARALVEVPVGEELPDTIPIMGIDDKVYQQKVYYEWRPVRCTKCGWFGHASVNCRKEEIQRKRREEGGNTQGGRGSMQTQTNATGGAVQVTQGVNVGRQKENLGQAEIGPKNQNIEKNGKGMVNGSQAIVEDGNEEREPGFTVVTRKGSTPHNSKNRIESNRAEKSDGSGMVGSNPSTPNG